MTETPVPYDPQHTEKQLWMDQMASFLDAMGMPPVAGRILGWLLLCDPPEQSSDQLAEACHASPGAISTTTRMLVQMNFVEKVRVRGSRKHFYRLKENAFSYQMHADLVRIRTMRQMAESGLELLEGQTAEQKARMREFYEINQFFEKELPAVIARWDALWKEKS